MSVFRTAVPRHIGRVISNNAIPSVEPCLTKRDDKITLFDVGSDRLRLKRTLS